MKSRTIRWPRKCILPIPVLIAVILVRTLVGERFRKYTYSASQESSWLTTKVRLALSATSFCCGVYATVSFLPIPWFLKSSIHWHLTVFPVFRSIRALSSTTFLKASNFICRKYSILSSMNFRNYLDAASTKRPVHICNMACILLLLASGNSCSWILVNMQVIQLIFVRNPIFS